MKKLLDKLDTTQTFNDAELEELITVFFKQYEENDRHKYHEITIYIISKYQKPEEAETITIILSNLELIMKRVEELCACGAENPIDVCVRANPPTFTCENSIEHKRGRKRNCYEYKWLHRKLSKLHDHISLEYTRISDIQRHNTETQSILKSIDLKEKELKREGENAEKSIENIKESLETTEEKFNKIQTDYITILGIFASIVLTFTGGIAFSTSVLENIDAISPFRLAAVVIGLAFVLINVVYVLVWFIRELNKRKDENVSYPRFMIFINAILILAMVATIFFWSQAVKSSGKLEAESTFQITIEEHSSKTE